MPTAMRARPGIALRLVPWLLACVLPLAGTGTARAQHAYPSRPITIVVPFGPGSGSDVGSRLLARDLTESLGQPVVVDNRPGANGTIGAQIVARAKPDGYTLLMGSATTNATNYAFFPGKLPYAQKDFEIVTGTGGSPQVLWVAATDSARTLEALLAAARRGGRTTCGSGNAVTQVACEILRKQAGIDMTTVSYKSNGQAVGDLATGQITMAFSDGTAALPYVEQGKVRAIAVAGAKRAGRLDDVATFREQGFPDIEMTAWNAVFAPAGTPEAVLEKLNAAIRRSNAGEAASELRRRSGSFDLGMPLPEARRFLASEIDRWERYVRESGVKPE